MALQVEREVEAAGANLAEKLQESGGAAVPPKDQSLVDRGVALEQRSRRRFHGPADVRRREGPSHPPDERHGADHVTDGAEKYHQDAMRR